MIFRKLKQESIFCWTTNNINYIILFFVTRWNAFKRLFCSPIFYDRPYLLKRQFRKKKDETKKTEKSRNLSNTPGKCWVIMSLFVGHFAQFLQHKLLPVNLCLFSTEVELHFFFPLLPLLLLYFSDKLWKLLFRQSAGNSGEDTQWYKEGSCRNSHYKHRK